MDKIVRVERPPRLSICAFRRIDSRPVTAICGPLTCVLVRRALPERVPVLHVIV